MITTFPAVADSLCVLVDIQEKFVPAIHNFDHCLSRCVVMLEAAGALNLDVLVTEQYPRGLGHTIPELKEIIPEGSSIIEKSSFSCLGEKTVVDAVKKKAYKNLILIGIESHVCVLQTALQGVAMGYNVYIPADCVSSRKEVEKNTALSFLAQKSVNILSCESILFMLMQDAGHPAFRAISKLIR